MNSKKVAEQESRFPLTSKGRLLQVKTREVYETSPSRDLVPLGVFISREIRVDGHNLVGSGNPVNAVTCALFTFLEGREIPTAFREGCETNWFVAELCKRPQKDDEDAQELERRAQRVLAHAKRHTGMEFPDIVFEAGINSRGEMVIADIRRVDVHYSSPAEAIRLWELYLTVVEEFCHIKRN